MAKDRDGREVQDPKLGENVPKDPAALEDDPRLSPEDRAERERLRKELEDCEKERDRGKEQPQGPRGEPSPNKGDGNPLNAPDGAGPLSDRERLIRSRHGQDLTPSLQQYERDQKALSERATTLPDTERKEWDDPDRLHETIEGTKEGDKALHDKLQLSLDSRREGAFNQQVTQRDKIRFRHSAEGDDVRDAENPEVDANYLLHNSDLYPYKGRWRADVEPLEAERPAETAEEERNQRQERDQARREGR